MNLLLELQLSLRQLRFSRIAEVPATAPNARRDGPRSNVARSFRALRYRWMGTSHGDRHALRYNAWKISWKTI